jgi:hypothetical protein
VKIAQRFCKKCGAKLASDNKATLCSPCNSGVIEFSDAILALIEDSTTLDIEDVADVLRPLYKQYGA